MAKAPVRAPPRCSGSGWQTGWRRLGPDHAPCRGRALALGHGRAGSLGAPACRGPRAWHHSPCLAPSHARLHLHGAPGLSIAIEFYEPT